ncbi:uncharacterized protein BYT42DRAFT_546083 [Radiomyces spectabilis]|uniref:uncharacterized protein n=1 Tax=Radiomyces spectabilis TaxID=64574 RepID=UPI00221F443A|nr:uncharacterized protein BYT42DRAFT_546083 [Radiomyces spectabilis]KAI8379786.1 hypothetical protein BYT42DRAFT_546083 [Radiomyces spectabilis]
MRDEDDLRLKWYDADVANLYARLSVIYLLDDRGESVGDSAGAVEGNTGFKVDVRAVRDNFSALRNRRESDAANVELARVGASLGKMFGDKMKLLVESKCVVDRTVKDSNPEKIVAVPAMQITGLHAGLFSVRLGAPGLYVAVSEGTCQLPKTADMLRDLREAYVLLRKFKDASVNLSNAAIYGNRSDHSKKDDLRDTWMPPRSGTRISPLPKYMLESVEESSI